MDTRPDQRHVYNDFGLLALRRGSNKFDDVWGVDCFLLACAFKGVTGSGRDFFASALTGAFKAVEQLQEGLVRPFTAACRASSIPTCSQFLAYFHAQVECLAQSHAQRQLGDCSYFHVVVVLIGHPKPRRLLGDSHNMHGFSRFSVAYVDPCVLWGLSIFALTFLAYRMRGVWLKRCNPKTLRRLSRATVSNVYRTRTESL